MPTKSNKYKKYKVEPNGPIYCSPDNGNTVYIQSHDGSKTLVYEHEHSKYDIIATKESYLSNGQAVKIRNKYPALKDAWEKYKSLWQLTVSDDDFEYWHY